ncbi:MAG TPA: lanthionine synthetase C family protein [Kofleriaceae bacterium]|nr:lanthionine synthetase C family protein [Kofleriaceae bacterium]
MVDGTTEPGWQPLIEDPERRAALTAVVVEIVAAVEAWRCDHPMTSDDDADYATLRIYTATDDTVPDPDDETGKALASAITKLGDNHAPALYGGAARVAFAVGHLSAGEDADLACEMIERSLLRFLAQPTESYDLISGLVGIAVPVLQRIADRKSSPSSEPLARNILDQLERLAQPMDRGLAWHTPPELLPVWQREQAPQGYTNLGLAHGIPGVIAILARYVTAGFDAPRARLLLDGAVDYLRSVAGPEAGNRYAAWLPARPTWTSRVAWCYGDLGVAVALMSAAAATGRDDWRRTALELAHGMAARPFEASQVVDGGLCHGAAGVAHLFNRLAQATGDPELAAAADTWFAHTLAIRRPDGIAGYPRALYNEGNPVWEPCADLLNGSIGVALALHAAISPIEPAWDQLLLADLSPMT